VIQSFTRTAAETRAMRTMISQLMAAQTPVLSWWALASIATRAAATLTVSSIFLLGTWLHLKGQASIGDVVMFMSIAQMLIGRLEQVVGFVNQLFMQAPKMREFYEILDTAPAVQDRPHAKDLDRFRGEVEFDDVSFSYDGKRSAILDVSFAVKRGETIALVGSTGSGKSTTLGLLHRAFDPQSGTIRIDGEDIRDIALSSLRRNIGVVFQEPMLFARSIRENLQVGRPDATDEEMREALERAQATEFIQRQTEGLDSVIGERGRSLSGGERQRLSIARALLKNPPVLILDEATSALDASTERKLQTALDEVMKGRTTFVIAHRLATDPQRRPHPRVRRRPRYRVGHLRGTRCRSTAASPNSPAPSSWPAPRRKNQRRPDGRRWSRPAPPEAGRQTAPNEGGRDDAVIASGFRARRALGKLARQFGRADLTRETDALPRPERRELARPACLRARAKRLKGYRRVGNAGAAELIGPRSRMMRLTMPRAGRPVNTLVSAVSSSLALRKASR
jgi:ABC-type nitrate/sulfonate/bicarbonate transport system ATPase subunit